MAPLLDQLANLPTRHVLRNKTSTQCIDKIYAPQPKSVEFEKLLMEIETF